VSLFKRCETAWRADDAIRIYNETGGDLKAFKRAYRQHARNVYGLDPVTVIMLLQMAIRLYFWAKENGFLSAIPQAQYSNAPSAAQLYAEAEIEAEASDDE
jgi:hypothetical protein